MASIHFKRHLIHNCVIYRGSATQGTATGEVTFSYTSQGSFDCRYVERREAIANEGVGFPMQEITRILFNSGVDIREEDQVRNITLKADSSLIEAGPLTVEELLKRNQTPGRHHISVKMERIE